MTSNTSKSIFQPDYYNTMPEDEFNIFCKRLRILHDTGKYFPPPPKITACKKSTKPKPVEPNISDRHLETVVNPRFGKGAVGRGHGSVKVKYCTCCNKRRDELMQYTTRVLGKDVQDKPQPLVGTATMNAGIKVKNLFDETIGSQSAGNPQPSTSNVIDDGPSGWMPFPQDSPGVAGEPLDVASTADSETGAVPVEEDVADRGWSMDWLPEASFDSLTFETSCLVIHDSSSLPSDNIIDLDNPMFVMPHSSTNFPDKSNASGHSDDVEIVDVYKIPTESTSRSAEIGARQTPASTSTPSKKRTESRTGQGTKGVAQKGRGSLAGFFGECSVCLESLRGKEIMATVCGHVFCAICIQNVIRLSRCCPICRMRLTLKSIHPIYI